MKQGEIWDVSLDSGQGSGRVAMQRAVIVNDDTVSALPSRVVAPIAEWDDKFTEAVWLVRVEPDHENNLGGTSVIDTFQVHSLPTEKFIRKVGSISGRILVNIKKAIKAVINAE